MVALSTIPEKLQGYVDPTVPTFSDVPLTDPAEKAVWLEIIPATPFFQPNGATTTCFMQDVLDAMQALPDFYAIVYINQPDGTIPAINGPSTMTRMNLYGTSAANHLNQVLRLVNDFDEPPDFTLPGDPTSALEGVVIRCQVPAGTSSYDAYPGTLVNGSADISVDCYSQAGDVMEIQIQVDPSPTGTGQEFQIGFDPGTLKVRRGTNGGQETNPRRTIN
jgi:hypothetical protein